MFKKYSLNILIIFLLSILMSKQIITINGFKLYVLKLEQSKFYIGKTNKDVAKRFDEHIRGYGAVWTRLYKPIKLLEQIDNVDKFDEDKYTKIYMDKFGIDNVRGGSYTKIKLDDEEIKLIKKELMTANDLCFKCGSKGHFLSNCKAK
jgi:hypothetical protein